MPAHGVHLSTLAHEGRFWDVYVELEEPNGPDRFVRARLRFSAPDAAAGAGPDDVHTAFIFVEDSPDAVVTRARALHPEQVLGLLRSCLP